MLLKLRISRRDEEMVVFCLEMSCKCKTYLHFNFFYKTPTTSLKPTACPEKRQVINRAAELVAFLGMPGFLT